MSTAIEGVPVVTWADVAAERERRKQSTSRLKTMQNRVLDRASELIGHRVVPIYVADGPREVCKRLKARITELEAEVLELRSRLPAAEA